MSFLQVKKLLKIVVRCRIYVRSRWGDHGQAYVGYFRNFRPLCIALYAI